MTIAEIERVSFELSSELRFSRDTVSRLLFRSSHSRTAILCFSVAQSLPARFWFRPSFLPAQLDRGFVCAIAHIRGGEELGRTWYEDGKLLKKKNTFSDFVCCAQYLIDQRYSAPKRVAILGGSAGGLLMGAVMNMRPDLFTTVIAAVPFVDLLNTMSDPSLPLTVTEYEEWGNPEDPKYFDYMASYSPYDNIG